MRQNLGNFGTIPVNTKNYRGIYLYSIIYASIDSDLKNRETILLDINNYEKIDLNTKNVARSRWTLKTVERSICTSSTMVRSP